MRFLFLCFLTTSLYYAQDNKDLKELKTLISSSKKVVLPIQKVFSINGILQLRDQQTLNGNGATIIQLKKNTPIISIKNTKTVIVENLTLIGKGDDYQPSSSSESVGIDCWGARDAIIRNNTLKKFSNIAIKGLRQINGISVSGNKIIGTGVNQPEFYQKDLMGITLGGKNISISKNEITLTSQGIMIAEGSDSITITNNKIYNLPLEHGVYVDTSCKNILISKNEISDVGGTGIKIQNRNLDGNFSENIQIIDNLICNTKIGDGILVYNSEGKKLFAKIVLIRNNILNGIGQHGINIRETLHANVLFNQISNVKYSGIYLRDNSYLKIESNKISTTQENGIFDEGSGQYIEIINNQFLNIGLAGNDHNGLSSGIFTEKGINRKINDNFFDNSLNMAHAIYIADVADTSLEIKNNQFPQTRKVILKIKGVASKKIKLLNNKSEKQISIEY